MKLVTTVQATFQRLNNVIKWFAMSAIPFMPSPSMRSVEYPGSNPSYIDL